MEPPNPGMKRITVHARSPNPLFEQWLEEWRKEAADNKSDMQYCFGKALKSLRKYPLRLNSGRECIVLECFGNKLCLLLDRRLTEYRKTHPEIDIEPGENVIDQVAVSEPQKKRNPQKNKLKNVKEDAGAEKELLEPPRKLACHKKYVPAWRSGPYAILVALLNEEEKPNYQGFLSKEELQRAAQPLCDKSFTQPNPGSHYTAWSSMSQLVKKELVSRYSNPAKFYLTDEGRILAKLLRENIGGENDDLYIPTRQERDSISPESESRAWQKVALKNSKPHKVTLKTSISFKDRQQPSPIKASISLPHVEIQRSSKSPAKGNSDREVVSADNECQLSSPVVLESGLFDVVLLVDTCETGGATKKNHNQTVSELSQMKVPFEVRKLEVGDFLWIARSKSSPNDELVIPYIVERKRMDDLGGSIKDGRFREQKFRLKQSGVQNLIYLVESHGSDQHLGLPLSTLQQAAVNTQIVDGFIVKHTIDHRHSMAYLATLTRILGRTFLKKTLLGCPKKDLVDYTMADDFVTLINYQEFKECSKKTKNFTIKEMLIRQLVQLKSLSVEKAIAIVEKYPTPRALIEAYRLGDENLLSNIPCSGTANNRSVGLTISKALHYLYGTKKLH